DVVDAEVERGLPDGARQHVAQVQIDGEAVPHLPAGDGRVRGVAQAARRGQVGRRRRALAEAADISADEARGEPGERPLDAGVALPGRERAVIVDALARDTALDVRGQVGAVYEAGEASGVRRRQRVTEREVDSRGLELPDV